MKLLPIDPSINTPGFAYFNDGKYKGSETFNVPKVADKVKGKKMRLEARLANLGAGTRARVQLFEPDIVLIEQAGRWTRAGKNVEALQVLAMATGVIFQAVFNFGGAMIYFVPVQDWKGNRKSSEIRREMELLFQVDFPSEHCSDATGMAHWWLAKTKIESKIGR